MLSTEEYKRLQEVASRGIALGSWALSLMQVYEFLNNPPAKASVMVNGDSGEVFIYQGDEAGRIGRVVVWHEPYYLAGALANQARRIVVQADNDVFYHGVYYFSLGDVADLKPYKNQEWARKEFARFIA